MSQGSADFSLRYVLRAARRRLPILIVCAVLAPAVAVGLSLVEKKQYAATASLLLRDPQFDQKLFGTSFVQSQTDPARSAATDLELVSLPRVAASTAAKLRTVSEDQVTSAVAVSSNGQSDLVSIRATTDQPAFAAKLANTFAAQYIAFRRSADRATLTSAEAPLKLQIAALPNRERVGLLGQSLQQRISQLSVLSSLQTGNAELVQPAEVPRGPSSPRPLLDLALGLFFGIVIGIALAVLAEALDRRSRDLGEVEEIFGRPLLAALPENASLASADPGLQAIRPAGYEAFRMLWVNLRYFSLSRDIRSVLVTSADRDDGKSTVAWGLAMAAAGAGARILLVEADLRNPTFCARFELPSRDGLTSVLAGDVSLPQAVMRLPLPVGEGGSSPARSMDVLVAGPRPPDPAELLQSRQMTDFISSVEQQYDMVIIDTPPATVVSDAIPLITMVRGVIVVTRLGQTVRDHMRRLRAQLDHLNAPVLGVVVNSVHAADPNAYGYGYGEYGPETAAPSPAARSHRTPPRNDRQPAAAVHPVDVPAPVPAARTASEPHPRPPAIPAGDGPTGNAGSEAAQPPTGGRAVTETVPRHTRSLERSSPPAAPRRRRLRDWLR